MRDAVQEKTLQLQNSLNFKIPSEICGKIAFRIKLEGRNRFAVLRDTGVESTLFFYGDCNKRLPFLRWFFVWSV